MIASVVLLSIISCLVLFIPGHKAQLQAAICSGNYSLGLNNLYELQWSFDGEFVYFTVTLDSNAVPGPNINGYWAALGFSNSTEQPFMYPSDVVFAYWLNSNTDYTVEDRYTVSHSLPLIDTESNIINPIASKDGTILMISFSRKLVTSDTHGHDVSLDAPRYWIWAFGNLMSSDPASAKHTGIFDDKGTVGDSIIHLPNSTDCSACNLNSCDPGNSITTNSSGCYCALSDICMAQPSPCYNNGSCTLTSPPDNFTCNCTGTGYTGDTCDEACGLSLCSGGYTLNSTSCTCYLTDICLANNPCNNNGSCTLTSPPSNFTCNCTGTGYTGDTCEACPLCDPGYSITTNSSGCYCVLSDICMIQPSPCYNNGSCTLTSPPDNFTCNCTGTGYTGDTCDEACGLSLCSGGYTLNSTSCTCYLTDICLADNPCNNGSCTLTSPPKNFTCNCTGTGYTGDTCEACPLCDPGYSITTNSSGCYCVLSDICMAQLSPCNNGSCTLTSPPDNFICNCTGTGYTGNTCEVFSRDEVATDFPRNSSSSSINLTPAEIVGYIVVPASLVIFILLSLSAVSLFVWCRWKRKSTAITEIRKSKPAPTNNGHTYTATNNIPMHPRYNSEQSESTTSIMKDLLNPTDSELQMYASASLPSSCLIEPSNLKLLEKIGQGEFGIVYRGILTKYKRNEQTITPVAIKTVKRMYSQSQLADHLIDEAEKMVHFNHYNVLSLTGVCFGLLESPCIIMPFMSNGSLLSYLRKESANLTVYESADENLTLDTTKQLLSMCLQVAKGMVYLTDQKFVHRDLAARNCMISSDGVIKVADFGLAEDVYTSGYFKLNSDLSKESVKLPIKWMALESIHLETFNEKTDVWSYGVLCWEVFTIGRMPYAGIGPKELIELLDSGERLIKPNTPTCTDEIYSLIGSCWYKSPEKRPHFTDIVDSVEQLMIPLAEYIDFSLNHSSHAK